jgi:hypothetical protein
MMDERDEWDVERALQSTIGKNHRGMDQMVLHDNIGVYTINTSTYVITYIVANIGPISCIRKRVDYDPMPAIHEVIDDVPVILITP